MGSEDFRYTKTEIYNFFRNYYYQIPVCGAIIYRNSLKKEWLVVKSPYALRYGFPKGKMNHGESEQACAIREVYEETGLSIDGLVNNNKSSSIEFLHGRGRKVKFFIVTLQDNHAEPQAPEEGNLEISETRWLPCDSCLDMYVAESKTALDLLRGAATNTAAD